MPQVELLALVLRALKPAAFVLQSASFAVAVSNVRFGSFLQTSNVLKLTLKLLRGVALLVGGLGVLRVYALGPAAAPFVAGGAL